MKQQQQAQLHQQDATPRYTTHNNNNKTQHHGTQHNNNTQEQHTGRRAGHQKLSKLESALEVLRITDVAWRRVSM